MHRNTATKRSGVSLVGVLVVIVVAFVAAAMVASYLVQSRENARRNRCTDNQGRLASALLTVEQAGGRFPGYVLPLPGDANQKRRAAGWPYMVLPLLDRPDLAKQWAADKLEPERVPRLICPVFPRDEETAPLLSYVVNCGKPGDDDRPADGVFFNRLLPNAPVQNRDAIAAADGLDVTLLGSENLQAGWWTDTAEADLGMVWLPELGDCSSINRCRNAGQRPHQIEYARPSSNHPGGVIATFCDGHAQFLAEQIDYGVFRQFMTPDSK